jgi:hypothetical protein
MENNISKEQELIDKEVIVTHKLYGHNHSIGDTIILIDYDEKMQHWYTDDGWAIRKNEFELKK